MSSTTIEDALVGYLTDAHSIEEQALQQLRLAPRLAGEPGLSAVLKNHLEETEGHERLILDRLKARGASPSKLKDTIMKAGGLGFVLFAGSQPDTPGKLLSHAYSYEHLEVAAYDLLERVAARADDDDTVEAARRIRAQEHTMAERLAAIVGRTVEASLRDKDPKSLLPKYLADAHALEAQAIQLLERAPKIAGDDVLASVYSEHLDETRDQQERIRERLEAHDSSPSTLKDAGLRLGALNWGLFFQAQPDTPGKLAAFAFAFEHLEIGGYEQLRIVAQRADDADTVDAVDGILGEERKARDRIASGFDRAAAASLSALGVDPR